MKNPSDLLSVDFSEIETKVMAVDIEYARSRMQYVLDRLKLGYRVVVWLDSAEVRCRIYRADSTRAAVPELSANSAFDLLMLFNTRFKSLM